MMSEPLMRSDSAQTPTRPFPWFCPRCRRKEVRRTTIPYECQRLHNGQPITLVVPELAVPQCGNCGELDFDYVAEEQINRAYQAQIETLARGNEVNGTPSQTQTTSATPPSGRPHRLRSLSP